MQGARINSQVLQKNSLPLHSDFRGIGISSLCSSRFSDYQITPVGYDSTRVICQIPKKRCGHCADGTIYIIAKAHIHGIIYASGNVWDALTQIIQTPLKSDDNLEYNINSVCVDTGYNPDRSENAEINSGSVFNFAAQNWNVRAIKGTKTISRSPLRFKKSTNETKDELYLVDTTRYKIDLFNRLLLVAQTNGQQPPNFINFPKNQILCGVEILELPKNHGVILAGNGFDAEFIKTFESETPIFRNKEKNEIIGYRKIHSRVNNHDLDTLVYNFAALEIYCIELGLNALKIKNASVSSMLEILNKYLEKNGVPI